MKYRLATFIMVISVIGSFPALAEGRPGDDKPVVIPPPPRGYEDLALLGRLNLAHAGPPSFALGDSHIVFSYEPQPMLEVHLVHTPPDARYVALAFAHENYGKLHTFLKSSTGVYYFVWNFDRETRLKLARDGKALEYRLIVDGVWMADPANPLANRKLNGALISYVDTSLAPALPLLSPEIGDQHGPIRTVILRLRAKPQSEIYVAGTFNNFDPYLHGLQADPSDPSLFTIELRLLPGQYFYYFVVNGATVLDSLNPDRGYGTEGAAYSRLVIAKES
jgi:hypothetical protein